MDKVPAIGCPTWPQMSRAKTLNHEALEDATPKRHRALPQAAPGRSMTGQQKAEDTEHTDAIHLCPDRQPARLEQLLGLATGYPGEVVVTAF